MFVRVKKIGPYEYLYLVENVREGGRTLTAPTCHPERPPRVILSLSKDRIAKKARRNFVGLLVCDGPSTTALRASAQDDNAWGGSFNLERLGEAQ